MVTPTTIFIQKNGYSNNLFYSKNGCCDNLLQFREAEGYNPVSASLLTLQNLACGFYKKLRYVHKSNA